MCFDTYAEIDDDYLFDKVSLNKCVCGKRPEIFQDLKGYDRDEETIIKCDYCGKSTKKHANAKEAIDAWNEMTVFSNRYEYQFPRLEKLDYTYFGDNESFRDVALGQITYVNGEVQEMLEAFAKKEMHSVIEECFDVIHSCETLLRMCEEEYFDIQYSYGEVITKNARRGYYGQYSHSRDC